ncbi:MAG: glycosyltransferase family 1 protein, partial [Oxalobacteraceae bacterium]
ALVMPSRYPEPYGLVAAEALWSGLPVVAAQSAFLSKDIERAGAGVGVDPRDTSGFGKVLRNIMDDDAATRTMSVAAFEDTRAIGLSPQAWTDRLMETYELAVKA